MSSENKYFSNINIDFYGGFGNNLQQIALAIMYCKKYEKNLIIKDHKHIKNFKFVENNLLKLYKDPTFDGRFFYYGSKKSTNYLIDDPLDIKDYDYYFNNFHLTLKNIVKPKLKFFSEIDLDPDLLVVHIRNMEGHPDYVQNPQSYYMKLFEIYEKVLIVTDNPHSKIIKKLKSLKNITIQSTSLEHDFNTLVSATNLATSGVGTFSIAAAMMSNKLENIYFSNFFLDKHLNPEMLADNIQKKDIQIINYLGFGNWNKDIDILNNILLTDYETVLKF